MSEWSSLQRRRPRSSCVRRGRNQGGIVRVVWVGMGYHIVHTKYCNNERERLDGGFRK